MGMIDKYKLADELSKCLVNEIKLEILKIIDFITSINDNEYIENFILRFDKQLKINLKK